MDIISRWNYQHGVKMKPMYGKATDYHSESALDNYILARHQDFALEAWEETLRRLLEEKITDEVDKIVEELNKDG